MFSWSDVGFAEIAAIVLAIMGVVKLVIIYNQRECINRLSNMYTSSDSFREYWKGKAECRAAEIKVLEEMLATYRPLAKKLVSVHVTSTHLHLKVRSDYAQDGNLEKAIGEITAILKDQL